MEALETLSPRAQQLAAEYQFGEPQTEYRDNNQIGWKLTILLLLIGIVLLCVAFLSWHSLSAPPSPDDGPAWLNALEKITQSLALTFFGLIAFIGGLAGMGALIQRLVKGEKRVCICTKGFIVNWRRTAKAMRWEDIKEVQEHIIYSQPNSKKKKAGTPDGLPAPLYTIQPKIGKALTFSREPGNTIEHEIANSRLPHYIEQYRAGKELSFGWLTLDTQGLCLNATSSKAQQQPEQKVKEKNLVLRLALAQLDRKQTVSGMWATTNEQVLPWSKLALLWIDESKNTLIISRKNQQKHWAMVPLNRVANVALFIALVEHVMNNKEHEIA